MCDVMQCIRAILTAGLFIAAHCQLFDRPVVSEGGSFNLTCDASRIGDVPTAVTEISHLSIEKIIFLSAGTLNALIAKYSLLPSEEQLERNIPDDRAWVIEVSGGKNPNNPENRASLKIILYVPDAKCSDGGLYTCKAGFRETDGVSDAKRSQKIIVRARIEVHELTLDHYNGNVLEVSNSMVGKDAKLTCKFEGPEGLELTWLAGPSGGTNFVPYPIDVIQMMTASPNNDPCTRRKYESTLPVKVPAVDTTYICVVKDGDNGASRKNFKIVLKTSTGNKGTHLGIMDSHWFVMNMLVMMVETLMGSRFVWCHQD